MRVERESPGDTTKSRLVQRWKQIEELEGESDDAVEAEFRKMKELWFADAFDFLHYLAKDEHCWCANKDVMFPLLEPFYNLPEDTSPESSLRVLWRRVSSELGVCTRCVVQHHKAKEVYRMDYLEDVVGPLLAILQELDEERVACHLKTLLKLVDDQNFDSDKHSIEVICVMFEVLMFPSLLEDAEVNEAFGPFLLYVEATHDLTLAKGQHYPGVYTILLHSDQGVRRVALSLVKSLEKFKDAQDMEPILPLLEKVMHCLESDSLESGLSAQRQSIAGQKGINPPLQKGNGRPRVSFKREAVWLGLPIILSRLEPAALEDGIVERYSVFVSIVLNHVSEATSVFYNALRCLELLLTILGYKLWLRTTFSAGVVRNTLVSQCFHSTQERMHKSIFELFQPFVQSLETLQDEEYERQRRRLLYFLLQQVPASRNFNPLMCMKARQISFSIICRGYTMDPPLPPLDCAHVWGPPLVASLRDASLHQSFRMPAFDLYQIILVADSSALAAFSCKSEGSKTPWSYLLENGPDEIGSEQRIGIDLTGDTKYWDSFRKVSDAVGDGLEKWSCVPLLWMEVLEVALPHPPSFCKSVLWALGRLAVVDPPGSTQESHLGPTSKVLRWEKPKGYDDRSDYDACVNVVPVQQHCLELISIFKRDSAQRCADGFMGRLSNEFYQWTWEPWFAEPLLLLLITSNTGWRDIDRKLMGHFAADSSLESGLELLCSSETSVNAVGHAMHHASRTLMKWPLAKCARSLNQLFFLGWKLLTLGQRGPEIITSSPSSSSRMGGFLPQPSLHRQMSTAPEASPNPSVVHRRNESAWQKLCGTVSSILWPLLGRTIMECSQLVGGGHELMLTRMLQLLPLVCKHIPPSLWTLLFGASNSSNNSTQWFQDLQAIGSTASRAVLRWWQDALIIIIEDLARYGGVSVVLKDLISQLLGPGSSLNEEQQRHVKPLIESLSSNKLATRVVYSSPTENKKAAFIDSGGQVPRLTKEVIDLGSDDDDDFPQDMQGQIRDAPPRALGHRENNWNLKDSPRSEYNRVALSGVPEGDLEEAAGGEDQAHEDYDGDEVEEVEDPADSIPLSSLFIKPQTAKRSRVVQRQMGKPGERNLTTLDRFVHRTPKPPTQRPRSKKQNAPSVSKNVTLPKSKEIPGSSKEQAFAGGHSSIIASREKVKAQVTPNQESLPKKSAMTIPLSDVLRDLVMDDEDDMLTKALNRARKPLTSRDGPVLQRRQIMTVQMPGDQVKPGGAVRTVPIRAPPPKLDMWFRQILMMDLFSVIGTGSAWPNDGHEDAALIKVPTTFPSVERYREVFQPLLLEEFKAQLQQSCGELSLSDGKTCAVFRLLSLERVDDFQIGRFVADGEEGAARAWTENDLLVLTRHRLQLNEPQSCHMLAKIDRKERGNRGTSTIILLKLCVPPGNSRLLNAKKFLLDRSKWHMTRVMSLTPHLREFQALSAIGNMPLLQTLLCLTFAEGATTNSGIHELKGLSSAFETKLKADYNKSQVCAIAASLGRQDLATADHQLALVQGPPGTGKTRTIVGIVSALLARGSQSFKASSRENHRDPTESKGAAPVRPTMHKSAAVARAWQDAAFAMQLSSGKENYAASGQSREMTMNRGGAQKQRILLCAQSNAAVDELVARLCKDGLYGADGSFFKPFLVRVGNVKTVHPDSMKVFIDTLVEERLGAERQSAADLKEEQIQQKAVSLRCKLEEVIEEIQVLEASYAERNSGETVVKDTLGRKAEELTLQDGQKASTMQKDATKAEAAKKVARVVQEGTMAVQAKLNILYRQRRQLSSELAIAEKEDKRLRGEEWAKKQAMRKAVIREADVVLTTLSGCGGDVYAACMESFVAERKSRGRKEVSEKDFFSAVVIDEAGQALEPATLIPLQLLRQTHARCVMVGDPKQLPATVLSQLASKMAYECSMFERLQRAGYPVNVLNTQYRMHPEIRRFPSAHFYDNQLIDGEGLSEGSRCAPFHKERCFAPYVFFDVTDGCQRTAASQSLYNEAEAEAAFRIYSALQERYRKDAKSKSFAVITPYKQQLKVIQDRFFRSLGSAKSFNIEFNTVDGYQGREVDILVLSTVRASREDEHRNKAVTPRNIGFVADIRRMNVALTRARFSLWIMGNAATLEQSSHWASLLSDAKERQAYYPTKHPYAFREGASSHVSKQSGVYLTSTQDKVANNIVTMPQFEEKISKPVEGVSRNKICREERWRCDPEDSEIRRQANSVQPFDQSKGTGYGSKQEEHCSGAFVANTLDGELSKHLEGRNSDRQKDGVVEEPQKRQEKTLAKDEYNKHFKTLNTSIGDEEEGAKKDLEDVNRSYQHLECDPGEHSHLIDSKPIDKHSPKGLIVSLGGQSKSESRTLTTLERNQSVVEGGMCQRADASSGEEREGNLHACGSREEQRGPEAEVNRKQSERPDHMLIDPTSVDHLPTDPYGPQARVSPREAFLRHSNGSATMMVNSRTSSEAAPIDKVEHNQPDCTPEHSGWSNIRRPSTAPRRSDSGSHSDRSGRRSSHEKSDSGLHIHASSARSVHGSSDLRAHTDASKTKSTHERFDSRAHTNASGAVPSRGSSNVAAQADAAAGKFSQERSTSKSHTNASDKRSSHGRFDSGSRINASHTRSSSQGTAAGSSEKRPRPSQGHGSSPDPHRWSSSSLESEWDLYQTTLREREVATERRSSMPPPPPTKRQKVTDKSSAVQRNVQVTDNSLAVQRNVTRPSTVDDILSGLGRLSRAQVMGSRVSDHPPPMNSNSARRS